jgi:hypothetical protein
VAPLFKKKAEAVKAPDKK